MRCAHCSASIDMTIPLAHAESYGGSTVLLSCPKCHKGTLATTVVKITVTGIRKYTGDRDQDDWGEEIKTETKIAI